ncbi:disulfide bond formation protein B [Halioglobus maricola]|uniref:Disulfide bond formation protein B n=1 Tax=Halioglobus maricola TaxID=2601894 RepID=A0A5P9NLW1_9GAMM|nr:disulfide bond formation protein B [Halioglobus maricola]QFU75908.1 disulfide bond formation protein B [Halioglobus maricola]
MNDTVRGFWAFLTDLIRSKWYWAGLVVLGLFMEGVALYYQYVVGDDPCQVCIHTRIWVAAFTLLAFAMCLLPARRWLNVAGHLLTVVCMAGLWERCKYLWDVERGRGDGTCEIYLNFPDWFALDVWFPAMFEVRTLCGFTPAMPFGFTMAEMLITASSLLVAASVIALGVNLAGSGR